MNFAKLASLLLVITISQTIELAEANDFKPYGGDIKALCNGQSNDLRNVGDLRNLLWLANERSDHKCSDTIIAAINEFELITKDTKACSVKKARDITQFYEKYFRKSDDQEYFEKLPDPLIRFTIAYGMRVSHICKKFLIDVFVPEADKLLTEQDFKEVNEWVGKKGPVGRLLDSIKKPDEIILPNDVSIAMQDDQIIGKLQLKVSDSGKLNRLKEICSKRFKPLYEQTIIPLAILSNSGIDYEKFSLMRDLKLLSKTVSKVALWSKIVFLCESLGYIEIHESSELPPDSLLPLSESKEAKATTDTMTNGDGAKDNSQSGGMQPIGEYIPGVEINDQILGNVDLRLKSIVAVYNKKKTEATRIKEKLLKRGWSLLVARFKHGEFRPMVSHAIRQIKTTFKRKGKAELVNQELVDLLDAKDETKLYKVISGVARFGEGLVRWFVITLMRIVYALVIGSMIITGLGKDKPQTKLIDRIKKF